MNSSSSVSVSSSFSDIAAFNKAAGDSLRLEILRVLAQDAYGVSELADIFQHKQSGMSHHLKVLSEAGLVMKRREGNSIFYSRALLAAGEALAQLHQQLYSTIDHVAITDVVLVRLQRVQDFLKLDFRQHRHLRVGQAQSARAHGHLRAAFFARHIQGVHAAALQRVHRLQQQGGRQSLADALGYRPAVGEAVAATTDAVLRATGL